MLITIDHESRSVMEASRPWIIAAMIRSPVLTARQLPADVPG
jgi:hypothetical protein